MKLLLPLFFLLAYSLDAQLVTTDPAVPTADAPLTITFDATQGTAGLRDCGCDVYLHTGVILPGSGEWQKVQTTWAVEDPAWKLAPVAGQPNQYTYTFSPTVREYYGVGQDTVIEKIALVFRNGDGTKEGKGAGGTDIFIDVISGDTLSLNLVGDPGTDTYPLGKLLPIKAGTTEEATIEVFDNGELIKSGTGTELEYNVRLTEAGGHFIEVVATAGSQVSRRSFYVVAELVIDRLQPESTPVKASVGDRVDIEATSYIESELSLLRDGRRVSSTTATSIATSVTLPEGGVTTYTVVAVYQGDTVSTSVTYYTGESTVAEVPLEATPGATLMDNGDLMMVLRAPGKSDVFVVGNLNDWLPTADTRMNRTPDDSTFWLRVPAASLPDSSLLYQYAIDEQGRYADPYSTLVLHEFNETLFGGSRGSVARYPTDKTQGSLSWLRFKAPVYTWQTENFEKPDPTKMVVYELLLRDFLQDHSFTSLTDTLDYLDRLGISTIELMPVSEFEGNDSWGYNPSFHMALDKYYGAPEDLKAFVDAAHSRGIAVVLDVVYNHAFGESPLIRMWPGEQEFEPGADNPYANVRARHPFNVGYDLNHESALTKEYVKNTIKYWLNEFRVDGFRWDLTKGFTQTFTGDDVEAWGKYDASRVAILKDYADHVWSIDEDAYMILEHLSENREENELAEYGQGMYFWSGFQPHNAYLEASMGYNDDGKSDIRSALANNQGFSVPNLIAYMESHDEERMMYKNVSFGNSAGDYNVRDTATALDRVELSSALFYSLPGPKMLWQFGELGYDYPINYCRDGRVDEACRTDRKPIRWDYRNGPARQDVYATISDLLYLRNNFDFFHGQLTAADLLAEVKYVHLSGNDGQAAVFGNFDVVERTLANPVPFAGTWYDYFSGESLEITNAAAPITLAPGEYHVYLSTNIARGGGRITTGTNDARRRYPRLPGQPQPHFGPTAHHLYPRARQSRLRHPA